MPRARVPSASITASSDALILPWLAPRALAESPVLRRRQRRGEHSDLAQKEKDDIDLKNKIETPDAQCSRPQWQSELATAQTSQPPRSNGASSRVPSRNHASAALKIRYADIASFARRQARGYTSVAASSDQSIPVNEQQDIDITSHVLSGTRYSRRRSWEDQLKQNLKDLDPQQAGRRRIRHITETEQRLRRYHKGPNGEQNRLIFNGQYRSLRRLVVTLRQHDVAEVDVRKDTPPDTVDELWLLQTFAALDRSVYARTSALTKPITLQHAPVTAEGADELLDGVDLDDGSRMFSNWHSRPEKQKFYESVLVYLLEHKPGYAQDFITILADDKTLPRAKYPLLADALAYLARLHLKGEYSPKQGWTPSPKANVRRFIDTFLHCTPNLRERGKQYIYSQDLLHSFVHLADVPDLKRIYDVLQEERVDLSLGTVLHYASALGEAGEFRYALQVLGDHVATYKDHRVGAKDSTVNSDRFHWVCATILRGSMREAKNYHDTPGIVAAFVQFGVKMDILLYDVIMHNAMDAGDFATAFKVFNALEGHGLKPDRYTFGILLNGCTSQNDPTMFKSFSEFCKMKAKELKDPWLAADHLHYTYVCTQSKLDVLQNAMPLWRTYLDLFDLSPLEPFVRNGSRTMKDAIDEAAPDLDKEKLLPTPMALYLMLGTEIQSCSKRGVPYLERMYKTYKGLLSSDKAHEVLVSLAKQQIIWNTFLLAFCKKQQYASASAVIRDMEASGLKANIYTWNIFMQTFFKAGEVRAADRVFELMRARGVEPDAYTYGVMARGYAKAQLIDRIGETMQHISEEDQVDPGLLRALSKVQDRADLTDSLAKNRLEKQKKDAEEAQRKAEEEAERSQPHRFKSLFKQAITFKEPTHWDNGGVEDANDFLEPDDEPATVAEVKAEDKEQEQEQEQEAPTTNRLEVEQR